ncbi:MAG TPA: hypothetical protein VKK79_26130 [Candidatus Lokiarchaeia archaeon]|nr:hypothetical protein [Candidatus Lokiarchaeia archaeon]
MKNAITGLRDCDWWIAEVKTRVDTIVGNQHRGSYGKAAMLLSALAEVQAVHGRSDETQALRTHFQQKCSRLLAFRRELREALKMLILALFPLLEPMIKVCARLTP